MESDPKKSEETKKKDDKDKSEDTNKIEGKKSYLEQAGQVFHDNAPIVFEYLNQKDKNANERLALEAHLKQLELTEKLRQYEEKLKELDEWKKNREKEEENKKSNIKKGNTEWKERKDKLIDEFLKEIDFIAIKKILEGNELMFIKEEDIENELSRIINQNIKDNPIIKEKFKSIFDKVKNNIEEVKTLNLMMAGISGAGKSSLTNAILHINDAEEGHGIDAQTFEIKKYSNPEKVPGISVYDTVGVETTSQNRNIPQIKDDIKKEFEKHLKDPENSLHGILYCIKNGNSDNRIEDGEIKFIKALNKLYGEGDILIIVFTQSVKNKKDTEDRKKMLREKIDNDNIEIISLLGKDTPIEIADDQFITIKAFGMNKLIEAIGKKCEKNLVKCNIKQIAKQKIIEEYQSDIGAKSEEILKKLENFEIQNTFNEECKYIVKYLIGDLNLNFQSLDIMVTIKIDESKKFIKNKILEDNKGNWSLKLFQEFKKIDSKYDKQLDDSTVTEDLTEKFDEYFDTTIKKYIQKIFYKNAANIFINKIKKLFSEIICNNIQDSDIRDLVSSNVRNIMKKIEQGINK